MGKRGKKQKIDNRFPKRTTRDDDDAPFDMDDEIDAFHKQRDVVPLDVNGSVGESDEDDALPVFDLKGVNDDEDDDDDSNADTQETGFASKIIRSQKFLREKFGGVEDDMHEDDDEEDEEEPMGIWGGKMNQYYNADNRDFEQQSSDDEGPLEEEKEVLKLQRQKAKSLSVEDFGLEDIDEDGSDESDRELTLEEISVKGISRNRKETMDYTGLAYEEVKKDLNALSREEQMDVLYSSAPELVGLLSELNDALEQIESKVNPLLSKVKKGEIMNEGGIRYLEVKQLLLLAYCQAITFYLLLKSEGQPVRDHPVLARLVEIKSLLDKTKQLDGNLPSELEEFLNNNQGVEMLVKLGTENTTLASDSFTKDQEPYPSAETRGATVVRDTAELEKVESLKVNENKAEKRKRQSDQIGGQSVEMLKVRAALEERLKQKGILSSVTPKPDKAQRHLKPVNGQLVTYDDFDDDAMNVAGATRFSNGHASSLSSSKLSQIVAARPSKPKVVSGDDDLPKRDDIGERRRKHELRVLAGAGIKSEDGVEDDEVGHVDADGVEDEVGNVDADMEDDDIGDSEVEYYKQVEKRRAAKLAAKAEIYSRTSAIPSLPETFDGKRQITYQMQKNRGLTRNRKKETKNPRKKYKEQHKKKVNRRKGQVQEIKKPAGPYGGETTGINVGTSRSTRFKN
ncbi:protein THALLO [Alnus glutinosa]|uniref:protein THALLO n=1 Tax=Alnus glutinosa TaxID=3517 RepID=UPI002D764B2C|nr:protein THALLO [Alnus glutinosa]XP_062174099.1 protein THALLO [Alnus glutinosa]XP_062174109.1 protein THALLO [Alnus glutinosa]XP_062174117.1 protein THALLO [Alnus glutinosa]XP_062174123.1 protein THALLO [Alnus glutinosa]